MAVRQDHSEIRARGPLWQFMRRSRALRRVKRRILNGPRRVPRRLGVTGFLARLEERDCRYVVLRWFEQLPEVRPGGDLDLLVDDDDAPLLDDILTRSPVTGGLSCDVYSVHGLPSYARQGLAYYPPSLAQRILDRSVRHDSGARVPCPEDHFLSLAFHALYHKGYSSGLPANGAEGPRVTNLEHDYTQVLATLADRLGLAIPITLDDLDEELERRGWRPAPDTLLKWSVGNPWCRTVVERGFDHERAPDGLVVCLVREAGADPATVAEIERMIGARGFIPLVNRVLDPPERERATRMVRGGNWGRGPWPHSGGPPAVMLAAIDPAPVPPTAALVARHPGADNSRVFEFKQHVREWWNAQQPADRHCNIMHTSDNAAHAAHYLRMILPEDSGTILDQGQR